MYAWNEWMNESEVKIGLDIAESTVYVIKNEQNKMVKLKIFKKLGNRLQLPNTDPENTPNA